jgi:uncharacterized 2Fe-2S/4Fe-4S cluster protein (DUF4445 family)
MPAMTEMKKQKARQTLRVAFADGRETEIEAPEGVSLAQALFLAGLGPRGPLCAGLGRCGRCRVRYLEKSPRPLPAEERLLDEDALARGERLSCLREARPGEHVMLPAEPPAPDAPPPMAATEAPLALAVDLGTTSLCWASLAGGEVHSAGQEVNPQAGAGAEIMSRLALAAKGHGAYLQGLVLDRLRALVAAQPGAVRQLCVAGNSAMTYLLLGLPVDGLARAPYALTERGGRELTLAGDLPPAYIPPLLGPFIGADVSAGLTALHLAPGGPPKPPWLLADLGTNAEFVLVLSEREYLAASVPLGPALEGTGMRCGVLAGPGAITAFELTAAGLRPRLFDAPGAPPGPPGSTGPQVEPTGLAGTAYLSLAAQLLFAGVLTPGGRFAAGLTPLAAKLAATLEARGGRLVMRLPLGFWLEAQDVEELLKVKAAFNLAVSKLLAEAGLASSALTAVYLSGALGSYARPGDLARLGFLPPGLEARLHTPGNTSLAGAEILVQDGPARTYAASLPDKVRVLDLTAAPDFQNEFVSRMRFAYVR